MATTTATKCFRCDTEITFDGEVWTDTKTDTVFCDIKGNGSPHAPKSTLPTHYTCHECGVRCIRIGSMSHTMINHMINAGEITVGEARAELEQSVVLPQDAVQALAGWIMARADQGDDWKAGDPEVAPCGCRFGYADPEQVELCEAHA